MPIRPDERARCEQCHRLMPVSRDNPCKNPDWWFCDECQGMGGIYSSSDRFEAER